MSQDAFRTPPSNGALAESAEAVDPRVAHAEERRAMLRELAELGMTLARELTRRTLDTAEAPEPAADAEAKAAPSSRAIPGPRHDPAESFARLSRAVRLTLALEAKTEEQLTDLRAGKPVPAPATESPPPAAANDDDDDRGYRDGERDFPSPKRNRIRDQVFDVINNEITDVYLAHDTLDALYERLTEGERYDDFVDLPLRQAVEVICEDLGLHPDWDRWTDDGFPTPDPLVPNYCWQQLWAPHRQPGQKRRRRPWPPPLPSP